MKETRRGTAILASIALAAASLATVLTVHASGAVPQTCTTDCEDSISPAGALEKSVSTTTVFNLVTSSGGIALGVTCTYSEAQGTTPTSGLGPVRVRDPQYPTAPTSSSQLPGGSGPLFADSSNGGASISQCTDTLGGKDSTATFGTWKLTFVDKSSDESSAEPNTGDKLKITVPMDGAKVYNSVGCIITVAPSSAFAVKGAYNDSSTFTVSKVNVPIALSGACPAGVTKAVFSGTYTFSPTMHDVS